MINANKKEDTKKKSNKKEDLKAKKKTQFSNYLTILNHENRLLIFEPICPKPFEDVHGYVYSLYISVRLFLLVWLKLRCF